MLRSLAKAASAQASRGTGFSSCGIPRCCLSSVGDVAGSSRPRSSHMRSSSRTFASSSSTRVDGPVTSTLANESSRPLKSSSDTSSSSSPATVSTPASSFVPRQHFPLPSATPSWYAGHMARAIRSMPSLLARYPPPLVIEARDARLPLTSINPVFEKLLRKAPTANDHLSSPSSSITTWRSRRLIVYLKRDLISPAVESALLSSLQQIDPHQSILFIDTRSDSDIKKVLSWVNRQARIIHADDTIHRPALSEKAERRARKGLSGAFRHTPTPEEGVRLLILGMPNVGKSSLLNGLRRVGVGKGKAASTAPHPGHTRKLTGTVRISKAGPSKEVEEEAMVKGGRGSRREAKEAEDAEAGFVIPNDTTNVDPSDDKGGKPADPPIYVYDTPGVMVPFLGHGSTGSERGLKLAITAGIKDSLFDIQLLADYLLYRLNLRPSIHPTTSSDLQPATHDHLPPYIRNLPLSLDSYISTCADPHGRTNSIAELLWHVAGKAPGSLRKGNVRDLDAAAQFMLQHWRLGKLDVNTELDLNTEDEGEIRRRVQDFFESELAAVDSAKVDERGRVDRSERVGEREGQSRTQAKKQQKQDEVLARKRKLMSKGIAVGAKKSFSRGAPGGAGKKRRK